MVTEFLLSILEARIAKHGEALVLKAIDSLEGHPPTHHILDARADAQSRSLTAEKSESQNFTPEFRCSRCGGSGRCSVTCQICQGTGR